MPRTKFLVVRNHEGDRLYRAGETRTVDATEVAHLVPHVLSPIAAGKSEDAPFNKAERAPAANKARETRSSKGK